MFLGPSAADQLEQPSRHPPDLPREGEVHLAGRNDIDPKPALAAALGATYHAGTSVKELSLAPDVVLERTAPTS